MTRENHPKPRDSDPALPSSDKLEHDLDPQIEGPEDDGQAMSVSDATLRPFVRALLALAVEIQERESGRT